MKLLFDLTPLDTPSGPRGIGRYIRELAVGLSELPKEELGDLEIIGLTSLTWGGGFETTKDIGSYRGGPRCDNPTDQDFYVWAYKQRFALWLAARRLGVDAVHIGDPHATPLFFGLSGCKKIVTCHDLVPSRFPDRYFNAKDGGAFVGARIERRRYKSADLVVAISDATRDDVISLARVDRDKVVRVYNGVDIDAWARPPKADVAAAIERFGLRDRPYVLYAGGGDWRKNVEGMFGAIARARAEGVDVSLAWTGQLLPYLVEQIEAVARKFGVLDSLVRVGYVTDDDLSCLYRGAIAHLLVSRCEGFGLTVVEAMAAGCPVVTTQAGSLAEVGGDATVLVDPEDPRAIGDAIVRIVRDRAFAEDLVRRGKERAPTFARAIQAREMARVYREFMTSGKVRSA